MPSGLISSQLPVKDPALPEGSVAVSPGASTCFPFT